MVSNVGGASTLQKFNGLTNATAGAECAKQVCTVADLACHGQTSQTIVACRTKARRPWIRLLPPGYTDETHQSNMD